MPSRWIGRTLIATWRIIDKLPPSSMRRSPQNGDTPSLEVRRDLLEPRWKRSSRSELVFHVRVEGRSARCSARYTDLWRGWEECSKRQVTRGRSIRPPPADMYPFFVIV